MAGAGPGLGVIPEHLAEVSTLSTLNTITAVNMSSAGYQQPGGAGAGPGRGPVQRQQPRHAHSHALLAQPGAGRGRAAAGAGQRPRRAARRRHQQAAGGDGGDVQVEGENSCLVLYYILCSIILISYLPQRRQHWSPRHARPHPLQPGAGRRAARGPRGLHLAAVRDPGDSSGHQPRHQHPRGQPRLRRPGPRHLAPALQPQQPLQLLRHAAEQRQLRRGLHLRSAVGLAAVPRHLRVHGRGAVRVHGHHDQHSGEARPGHGQPRPRPGQSRPRPSYPGLGQPRPA